MTGPESPPRKRGRLIGLENDEKEENMICIQRNLTVYDSICTRRIGYGNARLYLEEQRSVERMMEAKLPHILALNGVSIHGRSTIRMSLPLAVLVSFRKVSGSIS